MWRRKSGAAGRDAGRTDTAELDKTASRKKDSIENGMQIKDALLIKADAKIGDEIIMELPSRLITPHGRANRQTGNYPEIARSGTRYDF